MPDAPNQAETRFEELAKLPENNPGPVFQMTTSGEILLANGASRKLFANEGLKGENWKNLIPGFDAEKWDEMLNADAPYSQETAVAGSIYIFTFVRPQKGDFVYAYGNDVTEIRQAQRKLAEQAEKLQEMARFPEMNPGPVFRTDLEGNILLANRAARRIFGENILGSKWADVFPGMTRTLWEQILASAEATPVEARLGQCDYVFAHLRDSLSDLVFIYGSDITHQKKAERALLQAEKMATLGTLAAGVAHELNNPAAAVKRAAEQLRAAFGRLEAARFSLNEIALSPEGEREIRALEQTAREHSRRVSDLSALDRSDQEAELEDRLDADGISQAWELAPSLVNLGVDARRIDSLRGTFGAEFLPAVLSWTVAVYQVHVLMHEIGQGSGRLSEIVGALKNYSYLGQAPVQYINVHEGIENTLVILRGKMKQGIRITREYGADVPRIFAYGSELNQAWTNLLDNAVDAMNGAGNITIRTRRENPDVVVEIEDDGPGLPPGAQSRIFDPFFTTKDPGKGTGLGLSTTYGIVTEKHKGSIRVESRPGRTVFIVRLPVEKLKPLAPA